MALGNEIIRLRDLGTVRLARELPNHRSNGKCFVDLAHFDNVLGEVQGLATLDGTKGLQ